MALTVNTNVASTAALNRLNSTNTALTETFSRISSGLRITKAGDDAAGLGMAENMDALSKGLRQAMRNANDGVSVIEVAEAATNEVANIVKRMRELAVQASSETLENTERAYIQDEYDELAGEVGRIAAVSEFNGVVLGDGTLTQLDVQVGVNDTVNDRLTITLGDITATTLGVGGLTLTDAASAQGTLATFDTALDTLNQYRSSYGAVQNRLESALRNLESVTEKVEGAESRIRDADYAFETAQMSKQQIMQQAGLAVLGQANQINAGVTKLLG